MKQINVHRALVRFCLGVMILMSPWWSPTAEEAQYPVAQPSHSVTPIGREDVEARSTGPVDGTSFRIVEGYDQLPLHFEANRGQTDPKVKFLSRGGASMLFLTPTEVVLGLTKFEPRTTDGRARSTLEPRRPDKVTRAVLRMTFPGAETDPVMTGHEALVGKVNHLVGPDPTTWRTDVPIYARVRYERLYPGIDLVWYTTQRQMEYDFVVAPGADPGRIVLAFEGAHTLELDARGDLLFQTAAGPIRQRRPVIYQEVQGRRQEISGGYVLKDAHQIGFRIGAYDRSQPLVIDPVLVYATYLGGSANDFGLGIAVDGDGYTYVAGHTASADFPATAGVFQPALRSPEDVFVTKVNPAGTALVYSTYIGGSNRDFFGALAVDDAGSAYVAGDTLSADFPTTPGAFSTTLGGFHDIFVTKLNATGAAIAYSTYLGGAGTSSDVAAGLAIDSAGYAYVTGHTGSADFPTTVGAFQPARSGFEFDAFVTQVDPTGSWLGYSTYLGGTGDDRGFDIKVNAGGEIYLTGTTRSFDFPTTPGAFQPIRMPQARAGLYDAFVTKLHSSGSTLVYSTYLGGSDWDEAFAIAVDDAGHAFVAGDTFTGFPDSANFPSTPGAFQPRPGGSWDAFVTKLQPDGAALAYSTFLGGAHDDRASDLAIDDDGRANVTGSSWSADFPTTGDAFQAAAAGAPDAFVTTLTAPGTRLVYSTYFGGSGGDFATGIAIDASRNMYATGYTDSADLPTSRGAFNAAPSGGSDAFVLKLRRKRR